MPFRNVRERELDVEHEVRIAKAKRDLRVLEVVEVRLPREVVGALSVAGLRRGERLVDELARACDLGSRALHLAVIGAGRRGRDERGQQQEEGDGPSSR